MQWPSHNTNPKERRNKCLKESNCKKALFLLSQDMAYLYFYGYTGITLATCLMKSCNLSEIHTKNFHHVRWVVLTSNKTLSLFNVKCQLDATR